MSWLPTIATQLGHKWLPSAFEKSNPPSEDQYAINSEDYRQMRYAHPWGAAFTPGAASEGTHSSSGCLEGGNAQVKPSALLYFSTVAHEQQVEFGFPALCFLIWYLPFPPMYSPGNQKWIMLSLEQYIDEEMMKTLDSRVWLWTQTLAPSTQLLWEKASDKIILLSNECLQQ